MEPFQIAFIVVTVVAAVLGAKLRHFVNLLRQGGELLTSMADALEDRKLTKAEFIRILKEAKDVMDAWGKVLSIIRR